MALKVNCFGKALGLGPSDLKPQDAENIRYRRLMDIISDMNVPPVTIGVDIPEPLWMPKLSMDPFEPEPEPKLKIRDYVPMTDEFRAEMNQWLLNMFGRRSKKDEFMRLMITQTIGWGQSLSQSFAYQVC